MMTVKVKQRFHDKDRFSKVYEVGSVCEFSKERAIHLIKLGLVESIQKVEKKTKAEEE